jgi:transcriptional regulator with XRE-family HTH domain
VRFVRNGHGVAKRLRLFRERHGLTQETLARRARVTSKFISEIENEHANPTIDTLARIVENGLEIPLSAFFAEDAGDVRDDLAKLRALLGGQTQAVRRRALRVIKALFDE